METDFMLASFDIQSRDDSLIIKDNVKHFLNFYVELVTHVYLIIIFEVIFYFKFIEIHSL